jgi:hypothetical protein
MPAIHAAPVVKLYPPVRLEARYQAQHGEVERGKAYAY